MSLTARFSKSKMGARIGRRAERFRGLSRIKLSSLTMQSGDEYFHVLKNIGFKGLGLLGSEV